jgi:hypothetical protein
MVYNRAKDSVSGGLSWLSTFESENATAFEFLKWRCVAGIALLATIASGLSIAQIIDSGLIADYGYGILIAAAALLVFWLIEAINHRVTLPDSDS